MGRRLAVHGRKASVEFGRPPKAHRADSVGSRRSAPSYPVPSRVLRPTPIKPGCIATIAWALVPRIKSAMFYEARCGLEFASNSKESELPRIADLCSVLLTVLFMAVHNQIALQPPKLKVSHCGIREQDKPPVQGRPRPKNRPDRGGEGKGSREADQVSECGSCPRRSGTILGRLAQSRGKVGRICQLPRRQQ